MNYKEYSSVKDDFLVTDTLRLDCMNTHKAFEPYLASLSNRRGTRIIAEKEIQKLLGIKDDYAIAYSTGIRVLLKEISSSYSNENKNIIIPNDIYPVYEEIFSKFNLSFFSTLDGVDFNAINSSNAKFMLLALPLMPLGRFLENNELQNLIDWLTQDVKRVLFIDAAYCFEYCEQYQLLLESSQCVILSSLSKPWGSPQQFGIAIGPTSLVSKYFKINEVIEKVIVASENVPSQLLALFRNEWYRLSKEIINVDLSWQPPAIGYFSIINVPFKELLENSNMLGVPSSVFGSNDTNKTVITCLHGISQGSWL